MNMRAIDEIFSDAESFIRNLRIIDKNKKLVKFGDIITPEQIQLIKILQTHKKVAIVKARQLGISTVVRAFCFWECYTDRRTCTSIVASNKAKSAENLLLMDKRFYKHLPKSLQRKISKENVSTIQFSPTDSRLLAMTAKADSQDRGYTINTAHLSEFSFYNNAEVYLGSTLASTNDGRIIIESTPLYYGDPLHKLVQANEYDAGWHIVFFPWSAFPDYRVKPDDDFVPTDEEQSLMTTHRLDIEQICWRRKKLSEYSSAHLFRKDFPLTIEEGWTLDDKCYFTEDDLANLRTSDPYKLVEKSDAYVIGVDPAGGTGNDFSVATVISKANYSIVDKISSNTLSINAFAKQVIDLARKYNNALIHFELNNHGHAFKEVLNFNNYTDYREFTTTTKSKILLFDNLRSQVNSSLLTCVDQITMSELRSLQRSEKGLAPKHPDGLHDDNVISLALGLEGLQYINLPISPQQRMMQQQYRAQPSVSTTIANRFR